MSDKVVTGSAIAAFVLVALSVFAADLDQAKSDGLVGERADGFLGLVVESAPSDVVALVADINAKRKAEYQRIAKENNLTMEQVQALAGKKTVEKTRKGDWIFVNGGWQKK
jgi:uncharacterized protein